VLTLLLFLVLLTTNVKSLIYNSWHGVHESQAADISKRGVQLSAHTLQIQATLLPLPFDVDPKSNITIPLFTERTAPLYLADLTAALDEVPEGAFSDELFYTRDSKAPLWVPTLYNCVDNYLKNQSKKPLNQYTGTAEEFFEALDASGYINKPSCKLPQYTTTCSQSGVEFAKRRFASFIDQKYEYILPDFETVVSFRAQFPGNTRYIDSYTKAMLQVASALIYEDIHYVIDGNQVSLTEQIMRSAISTHFGLFKNGTLSGLWYSLLIAISQLKQYGYHPIREGTLMLKESTYAGLDLSAFKRPTSPPTKTAFKESIGNTIGLGIGYFGYFSKVTTAEAFYGGIDAYFQSLGHPALSSFSTENEGDIVQTFLDILESLTLADTWNDTTNILPRLPTYDVRGEKVIQSWYQYASKDENSISVNVPNPKILDFALRYPGTHLLTFTKFFLEVLCGLLKYSNADHQQSILYSIWSSLPCNTFGYDPQNTEYNTFCGIIFYILFIFYEDALLYKDGMPYITACVDQLK
jgi:hypothetical protein